MGIHLPRVKFSTTLSIIFIPQFGSISSFSCSTNRRKIQFGKEYGRVPTTNAKFAQFTILPKSNSIYFFSRTSNWRRIWAEEHLEVFCEKLQWFKNMLDSLSHPKFQEPYSSFPVSPIQNEEPSILDLSMEPLRESEQQPQNPMDSQFHHNFQNQFPYSPFQEESIAKSIKDIIQTQNSDTRLISRLTQ